MVTDAERTACQPHIGYAAMSEQFAPTDLVEFCQHAEACGFSGAMVADHFQPWTPQQGQAPFAWNVMTAVAERTRGDVGPGVTCPSFRFHPAVVAQASATLAAMYPGRHWLGLGSGEALNEHVVGGYWPEAPVRLARMWEAVEIIQKLFSGSDVKHQGEHFRLESTRLWTMPEQVPPIYVATAGPITARRAGRVVDGIITPGATAEKVAGLFAKFDEGAKQAERNLGQLRRIVQLHLSWAPTYEEALTNALTEWPNGGMKFPKQDIRYPSDFAQIASLVRAEDFVGRLLISEDLDAHRHLIQTYLDLGADAVYVHNVGRNQREWAEVFGQYVLPALTT